MQNPFEVIDKRLSVIEHLLLDIKHPHSAQAIQTLHVDKHVYGIEGLAKLLKCSLPTAQKIKNSGKIPYSQVGRKLVFDADEVLRALNRKRAA